MNRRRFLSSAAAAGVTLATTRAADPAVAPTEAASGTVDREYWVQLLNRIADPVLMHLSKRTLKARMPVEIAPPGTEQQKRYTHLEAFGRLLCGLAPWVELGSPPPAEATYRQRAAELARAALAAAVDPASQDRMNFSVGRQPVVDAAFLAQGILRAPRELWGKIPPATQAQIIDAMRSTRVIRTSPNNHLLFSAMVEAFLCFAGADWDPLRIDYALRQHEQWYKGDGHYGDGAEFHWDYYNSFVIHPMLLDTVRVPLARIAATDDRVRGWADLARTFEKRALRYAAVQERLISPEGTLPPIGRSLAYRSGALHLLAQLALLRQLPEHVTPAQVRGALTAVMRRMFEAPGTFTPEGWLTIGLCGHQPALGEGYISTGSLYLCSAAFLPLGLPVGDEFWSGAPTDWTARRIWSGCNEVADHALKSP